MAETETTNADTTIVKQRFTDPDSSDISSIYPANSSSISADTWGNRIQTDAKIIFDRLKDENSTDTNSIEMRDMATQVSISTDIDIELLDMLNVREGDDMDQSGELLDIFETSFIQTRSGQRYKKLFVIKNR